MERCEKCNKDKAPYNPEMAKGVCSTCLRVSIYILQNFINLFDLYVYKEVVFHTLLLNSGWFHNLRTRY